MCDWFSYIAWKPLARTLLYGTPLWNTPQRCWSASPLAPLHLPPGFTFVYPARWLADQTLYRRYAERVERQAALDPPSLARERTRRAAAPEPAAAYGPAGSSGAGRQGEGVGGCARARAC